MAYVVRNYPADGQSLTSADIDRRACASLEEAREEVKRRLGDLDDWRKWDGMFQHYDVEAYHESHDIGCGGVVISK